MTTRLGCWEYADTVVDAIGNRTSLVVVAQSAGGFTAPLVASSRRLTWAGGSPTTREMAMPNRAISAPAVRTSTPGRAVSFRQRRSC
jgi:hypothetical protein